MISMIEYGVSERLRAEFDMLRETESIHAYHQDEHGNTHLKYSSKTVDKLAQYIVCRNYGKCCLELAYLCWPLVRHHENTQGLIHFFWVNECLSPAKFRGYFGAMAKHNFSAPSVSLNELGLTISAEQQVFTISATRVPVLGVLLEFLVGNVPGILDDIESQLNASTVQCVKRLASLLQKKLYAFLKDHLPSANVQHKYRYIHAWVNENWDKKPLNDEAVLDFWMAAINQEGYVKFENTLLDILDYQYAHEQVNYARAINFSEDKLEDIGINSDESSWLYHTIFELADNDIAPPTWLVNVPKFLSKKSYEQVSLLYELGDKVSQFPLSVLRASVFGQWQNTIIQQTRNKKQNDIVLPTLNYQLYFSRSDDWQAQAANTLLACTSVLFELRDVRCITTLPLALELMLKPQESREFTMMLRRLMQSTSQEGANQHTEFTDIRRWTLQAPTLNQFFVIASKALAKNNRVGFKNEADFVDADIYELGALELTKAAQLISNLQASVSHYLDSGTEKGTLDTFFASDLFIFKSELIKRHGTINDEQ